MNDSENQKFLQDKNSSLQLVLKSCQSNNSELICDTSNGLPRPFVPKTFRKLIFDQLLNISHPRIAATTKLICARYVCPNVKGEIREWLRAVILVKDLKFNSIQKLHLDAPEAVPIADMKPFVDQFFTPGYQDFDALRQ
ncbi:retrovirus-related Pol polyprotein from transposon 412 [Trichonephila clavipes]|nr:retrovirus-related Pol polyprotein from transposon 412 [Trichonephila clavipes]